MCTVVGLVVYPAVGPIKPVVDPAIGTVVGPEAGPVHFRIRTTMCHTDHGMRDRLGRKESLLDRTADPGLKWFATSDVGHVV